MGNLGSVGVSGNSHWAVQWEGKELLRMAGSGNRPGGKRRKIERIKGEVDKGPNKVWGRPAE